MAVSERSERETAEETDSSHGKSERSRQTDKQTRQGGTNKTGGEMEGSGGGGAKERSGDKSEPKQEWE